MQADAVVASWFEPVALATYVGMKTMEMKLAGATVDEAMCRRYAEIY